MRWSIARYVQRLDLGELYGNSHIGEVLEKLEREWPQAQSGRVWLSSAQLSMLLEGIDWRHPLRTADRLIEM